jgi:porin
MPAAGGGTLKSERRVGLALICAACTATAARAAVAPDPDVTLSMRETADAWRNVEGGESVGWTSLNKLQVSGTWTANRLGEPGFRLHLQVFRTNGERLTSRVGDLQTVSNIEALSATRLFEAWAEQRVGKTGAGGLEVRAGLIDLNSDFDSIAPAGLFINSSHGIGPDLSKSGRNGPSIFPVSAAAVRLTWTPTPVWTVRGGLFDGVPGDPDHPKAFAAVRLGDGDGALAIGEADRKLGKDGQLSLGAWRYSAELPSLDGDRRRRDGGVFAFVEGPLPELQGWDGWMRVGAANGDVQAVSRYFGAGVVRSHFLAARPGDRLGLAVSRAAVSSAARTLQGLRGAETTFEATYQLKIADWIAAQPDIQYVVHPSSRAGLSDALVMGVRLVVTAGYPKKAPATEQADPTVPPDAPADPAGPPQP